MQDSVQVIQELIKESLERRTERAKEAQEEQDEDDEEEMEREAEREEILIQNLVECLGALFKVYGSSLLPLFDQLLLPIFEAMLQPTAIPTDRVAALCIFDDIIEHCSGDGGSARYVPALTPRFAATRSAQALWRSSSLIRPTLALQRGDLWAGTDAICFGTAALRFCR